MVEPLFKNAVAISHRVLQKVLSPGDRVLDATCGRGHDTLFLANLVGEQGRVYAFDIQDEAVVSTCQLLARHGVLNQCTVMAQDHAALERLTPPGIRAGMFNLGYLPGGKHDVITRPDTTLAALDQAFKLLKTGGVVTVVAYPGHPGGEQEYGQVRAFLAGFSQQQYEIAEMGFVNQVNDPPRVIIIQKLFGGRE